MSVTALSVGQKIKNFRTQKKVSQSELELEANLSFGTVSRIENEVINPTKETLIKIVQALELLGHQAASLFDINTTDLGDIYTELASTMNINEILQKSVNQIVKELNLLGGVVLLVKGPMVYAHTFTQTWYTELAHKIIGKPFSNLSLPLTENSNYIVKTINEKKVYVTHKLSDSTVPPLSSKIVDLLAKLTGHKSAISFPILSGEKVFGAIYFSKNYEDDFSNEYKTLEKFVTYISQCIQNAEKYEQMQNELIKFKKMKKKK